MVPILPSSPNSHDQVVIVVGCSGDLNASLSECCKEHLYCVDAVPEKTGLSWLDGHGTVEVGTDDFAFCVICQDFLKGFRVAESR